MNTNASCNMRTAAPVNPKISSWLARIAAVLLAISPILQHYNGIVDNAATTVLAILVPYLALCVLPKLRNFSLSQVSLVLVLIIYFLYKMVDHGTTFVEIAQVCLMIGYLASVALGCVDVKTLTKAASCIAAAAGACVIVQYVCYYVLDFHLQMVPTGLLLPESEPWVLGAQTGFIDINGKVGTLYRPAAFFLEPSHLFLYSFPVLVINLFAVKRSALNWACAILATAGMVLCTSGMGIAVAAGAWVLFFALYNKDEHSFRLRNIVRKRNLIILGILAVVMILVVVFVPFVRQGVARIFSSTNGSSAISGRTSQAMRLLANLEPLEWVIGVADTIDGIKFNMPGFMATVYKYGLIGVVLSYEFYVKGLFKLDISYAVFCAILLMVSFFSAHTHGTFFMLYYVLLLMEGYRLNNGPWLGMVGNDFGAMFRRFTQRK